MARTILVVEDEPTLRETLAEALETDGFHVITAADGREALTRFRADRPDLVLLDLMLPELSGVEVCRILRAESATPIIMLTAKDSELDKVVGLELGADDYVTKPFSPKVLVARIRAVLRRHEAKPPGESAVLKIHDISINPGRHEVLVAGKPVELTYTEFRILHFLARRPGWVFTRGQIVEAARGEEIAVTDRSVDVHIVSLRRKLGDHGEYVETVRGVGYRFGE